MKSAVDWAIANSLRIEHIEFEQLHKSSRLVTIMVLCRAKGNFIGPIVTNGELTIIGFHRHKPSTKRRPHVTRTDDYIWSAVAESKAISLLNPESLSDEHLLSCIADCVIEMSHLRYWRDEEFRVGRYEAKISGDKLIVVDRTPLGDYYASFGLKSGMVNRWEQIRSPANRCTFVRSQRDHYRQTRPSHCERGR